MNRLRFAPLLACALALTAAEPANRSLQLRPDAEGFVRDWLMLAPIPLPTDSTASDPILKAHLPNEAALKPKIAERAVVAGQDLMWRAIRAQDFYFDFNQILGEVTQNSIGYMVTHVVCDREISGLNLLADGNDQWRLFLNGREVLKRLEAGPMSKDAHKAENLTLQPGVNTIVFKVINELNNWQGCVRFTDKSGKPVTDFAVKLAP